MQNIRVWAAGLMTAALLAACGGGDPSVPGSGQPAGAPTTKGSFTALVSFGDSLSDVGAYAPATSMSGDGNAPYLGGKFTTNSPDSTVWVQNLATALGLMVTPAQVGWGPVSVMCPAAAMAPALGATCTAYGQGGSRVTDPVGIGHANGALTVPMAQQVANHLERFGSFSASDLVVVFGGNNDVFVQAGTLGFKASLIQADGSTTADQKAAQLLAAQLEAQAEMKKAALELSALVRDQILAKGAKYVAVWNLPDSGLTPYGLSIGAQGQATLAMLVDTFNLWLREGLTGLPVRVVDANAGFRDVWLNPSKYGITQNQVPACDADKIAAVTGGAVTDGSSLFCNATPDMPFNTLREGADVQTWQFADGVHPTTGGHKLISDSALQALRSFGWID